MSRVDTETDRRLPEGHPLRGPGRGRQRQARVPACSSRAFAGAAVGRARGDGRARAAAAVGVDLDEEPGVLPHALRRHADRPRHGQHARAGVGRRARRGRRRPPRRHRARRRRRGARQAMAELAGAGVDFDDVTATLEREGVDVVRDVVQRRARHAREEGARAQVARVVASGRAGRRRVAARCGGARRSRPASACAFRPLVFGITYGGRAAERLGLPAELPRLRSTAAR